MSDSLPIGKREDQTLEFKSADALKKPFTISREVVAMLNAQGGDIWIGIRDQDDVATAAESIPEADNAKKNLLNHLESVMDPKPRDDELSIDVIEGIGARVLKVHVTPREDRRPYALLRDGGHHFVTRLDHRVRAMSRDEFLRKPVGEDTALTELRSRRDAVLARRNALFWIGIQPRPRLAVDVQSQLLTDLLTDPTRSDNRHGGWSFHVQARRTELKQGRRILGDASVGTTEIHEHGGIDLTQSLHQLAHNLERPNEIYPLAVLEYVVSMTRLAVAVYRSVGSQVPEVVLFDITLTGATGWKLPAYAPGTWGYHTRPEEARELEGGTYAGEPLEVAWTDLLSNPDRVGFRLVRALYQAFGLPEQRIPSAYDRATERLVLTD